jgi:hypothetical protein
MVKTRVPTLGKNVDFLDYFQILSSIFATLGLKKNKNRSPD